MAPLAAALRLHVIKRNISWIKSHERFQFSELLEHPDAVMCVQLAQQAEHHRQAAEEERMERAELERRVNAMVPALTMSATYASHQKHHCTRFPTSHRNNIMQHLTSHASKTILQAGNCQLLTLYWSLQSGFSELLAGGELHEGQSMTSPDGHSKFAFQDDGNLVVRTESTTVWKIKTNSQNPIIAAVCGTHTCQYVKGKDL